MEFSTYEITRKSIFSRSLLINRNNTDMLICESKGFFSSGYLVKDGDSVVIDISREFSFFKIKYTIDTDNEMGSITKKALSNTYVIESTQGVYTAEGNFWSTSFKIYYEGRDIAMCTSPAFSSKFQFAVEQGPHEAFVLGIVLSIMLIRRQQRKRSSG